MNFKINQGRATHPLILVMVMSAGFGLLYYTMTSYSETTAIVCGLVIAIFLSGIWSLHRIISIDFATGNFHKYMLLFGQKIDVKEYKLTLPLNLTIHKEIKYDDLKHIAILSDQSDQKIILAKRRNRSQLEKIIAPLLQEDAIKKQHAKDFQIK